MGAEYEEVKMLVCEFEHIYLHLLPPTLTIPLYIVYTTGSSHFLFLDWPWPSPVNTTMAPRVKDLIWMRNRFLFAVRAAVEQVLYVMLEVWHVGSPFEKMNTFTFMKAGHLRVLIIQS